MAITLQQAIEAYTSGKMTLSDAAKACGKTVEQLNEAITKALLPDSDNAETRTLDIDKLVAEHQQKADEHFTTALDALKGFHLIDAATEAGKGWLENLRTPKISDKPSTGIAPLPMKWADAVGLLTSLKNVKNITALPKLIGSFFRKTGIDKAALEKDITKLVADMAAKEGISVEQATQELSWQITQEMNNLKRAQIAMDPTKLRAFLDISKYENVDKLAYFDKLANQIRSAVGEIPSVESIIAEMRAPIAAAQEANMAVQLKGATEMANAAKGGFESIKALLKTAEGAGDDVLKFAESNKNLVEYLAKLTKNGKPLFSAADINYILKNAQEPINQYGVEGTKSTIDFLIKSYKPENANLGSYIVQCLWH